MMFRDYSEFWKYCMRECPDERLGCAKQCELRRRLKIPPFSDRYKLAGRVSSVDTQVSVKEALRVEA